MRTPFRAAATALLFCLLACPSALAADRDRDRMPDAWERRHKVDKPRGDRDRDGLRNRDEYRFGWHPRRRDTDRDGIRDGRENAGVVVAVAGLRVTIRLASRGRLTGRLEDPQALECAAAPGAGAGDGDWAPPVPEVADEEPFWEPEWGEPPADLDAIDEDDEDAPPLARAAQARDDEEAVDEEPEAGDPEDAEPVDAGCRATLKVGALVHEATSDLGASGRRFTRLRLVTP